MTLIFQSNGQFSAGGHYLSKAETFDIFENRLYLVLCTRSASPRSQLKPKYLHTQIYF